MATLSHALAAAYWSVGIILAIAGLRRTAHSGLQLARAARAQGVDALVPELQRLAREAVEGIAAWLVVTCVALLLCAFVVG